MRDLEHLIWERRVTVILQLIHWKLSAMGLWTILPDDPATTPAAQAPALFDTAADYAQRLQT